jgi:hypothetical protein
MSLRLVAASFLASAAIAGGLAVQMAHGKDPALGAGTTNASSGAGSPSSIGQSQAQTGGFDQSQDRSGFGQSDFGQSASTPGSVTSRAS